MPFWTAEEAEREARVVMHLLSARRPHPLGVSDGDLFEELAARGLPPMQAEYVVGRLASRGELYRDPQGRWRARVAPPASR